MNGIKDKKHYTIDGIELFIQLDLEARPARREKVAGDFLFDRYGLVDRNLTLSVVDDFMRATRHPEKGGWFKMEFAGAVATTLAWSRGAL